MMVNSPLEIYSTVIGARLYDSMFNILVSFGIPAISIAIIFFSNIASAFESEKDSDASVSIHRTGWQLFMYMLAMAIFVVPTHQLDVTAVTYKPSCNANAQLSRFGDTGTTYDNAFETLAYDDVRIPPGMALCLVGVSGITNAAIASLPCKTDVQAMKDTIDTTHLTPDLAQQVTRFQNECFAVARSQFDNQHPDQSTYQETMNNYGGQSDLSWVGSHVFQDMYYGTTYPSSPVPGFAYSTYPYKYQNFNSQAGVDQPQWGFPSCQQWWSDPVNGLQTKLVNLVQQHQSKDPHLGEVPITAQVDSWLATVKNSTSLGSQVTPEDVISHSELYDIGSEAGFGRLSSTWMDDRVYSGQDQSSNAGYLVGGAPNVLAQAGQGMDAALNVVKRAEIDQEIPILQAVLMAFALSLGPLIMMLGGFRFQVIFSYYFILSSVISITFVEKLIHYFELSLHDSMSYGIYALSNDLTMYNVFTMLYQFGPMIYLSLMSICGVMTGNALGDFFRGSISGSSSGKVTGAIAGAASTAAKAIL